MAIFYEDLAVGEVEEFGAYDVTEAELLAFAEQYDPQWFHVDKERAEAESMYGGLITSGWHTASMTMRMLVDHHFSEAVSLGAKGIHEIRWRVPVRAGDTLSVRTEILEKEVETPSRGVVVTKAETLNQADEVVMRQVSEVMYARRDGE
ncbi:Acyl dehydratase [Halogranum gelatinilyticum]|uniref:Acyl dehydratase n=1 Tax=Halogranum gelatinilyticum TaxID=660521 RepID=A0A1G9SLL2_9EURY|nr:MaoC family dehydratase [Halogranum gelatinilyticum]SDM36378.1 Acyl dehydratase [Halogranum gelatinilyticum]